MAMFTSHRQPPASWTKLIDEWVLDMQARCLTERTVESYWYRVTDFARVCSKPPRQVSPVDVQSWLTESDLDASAKAGRRASINEFYKWAVRSNKMKNNPVASLPPIKRPNAGESIYHLLVHGKGGKTRIVPISNDLAQEIRSTAGEGWLFPGKVDGHCCVDHAYRVIKRTTG